MVLGAEGRDQGRGALLKYRGEWSGLVHVQCGTKNFLSEENYSIHIVNSEIFAMILLKGMEGLKK
jgi:hypothetical protein